MFFSIRCRTNPPPFLMVEKEGCLRCPKEWFHLHSWCRLKWKFEGGRQSFARFRKAPNTNNLKRDQTWAVQLQVIMYFLQKNDIHFSRKREKKTDKCCASFSSSVNVLLGLQIYDASCIAKEYGYNRELRRFMQITISTARLHEINHKSCSNLLRPQNTFNWKI